MWAPRNLTPSLIRPCHVVSAIMCLRLQAPNTIYRSGRDFHYSNICFKTLDGLGSGSENIKFYN